MEVPRQGWRIFCTGVGGQGTLLATRILGEAALLAGVPVVVSEIHGMAQRGGVVESAVLLGSVRSPTVADGEADILMGFEPLETLRALRKCSARSLVISNTSPVVPFTVASGRARYPNIAEMLGAVARKVARLIAFDARAVANEAGMELAINTVLLGTLIRHGDLPLSKEITEQAIRLRTKGPHLDVNLKAFQLGYQVE
jgi:indolepyruvate ferredoxin oxidoreductase beta subunit